MRLTAIVIVMLTVALSGCYPVVYYQQTDNAVLGYYVPGPNPNQGMFYPAKLRPVTSEPDKSTALSMYDDAYYYKSAIYPYPFFFNPFYFTYPGEIAKYKGMMGDSRGSGNDPYSNGMHN